jgi:hypothetical protein
MGMSPVGLGTENDYAGEDQQQFNLRTEPTPPLVEEEAPFQNTKSGLGMDKIMITGPDGAGNQ